jgi:eukaryotic-like serine/threonine-protein kinase
MAFRIERDAEPIPGYRLVEPLGRGGFGEVWKAEAPGGILKAIKFVFGDLESLDAAKLAARQELRSLARVKDVRHPFLLSLERFEVVEGQLIIVTELADGDLWGRFRACRAQGLAGIPREELLGYLEETGEVLDLMNAQYDLQHMDVKPQNLCLMHSHIKVADFGLVKDLTGLVASVTGGLTPKYAPPETFRGQVSRYSDQYSLAIVYQELLTGAHPYPANTLQELMRMHTEGHPDLVPLPVRDRPAVAKALAKDPTQRHPSCRAFARALREAGGGVASAVVAPSAGLHSAPADTPTRALTARTVPPAPSLFGAPACEYPEERGDGVLRPALVVGLGGFGLEALRQFRQELSARCGGPAGLPHLRLLGVDADPAAAEQAVRGDPAAALDRDDLLLARLGRPSHYLRPRDPLPPLDNWLPTRLVNRLGRNPLVNGARPLGRLAFVDNYRGIAGRLRRELERVTAPEALAQAAQHSGLGPRSNWPRVYLVAALGGGTGSGMLIDLAYTVRDLLHKLGYGQAEVVGLLLPGRADGNGSLLAQANGYAALAELSHFSSGELFEARYEARGLALESSQAPLDRMALLSPAGDPAGAAGAFLCRELLTALGRETEEAPRPGTFQTFGTAALESPGRRLLGPAVRRLCEALVGRWARKGAPDLGPAARQAIQDLLHEQKLDPQGALAHFQAECTRKLGKTPVEAATGWLESLAPAGSPWMLDLGRVPKVLRQLDGLLGTLDEETLQSPPVPAAIREAAEQTDRRARQLLRDLLLGYMDRPGYRLGGATEAVRQAVGLVERWLQVQESQAADLSARVRHLSQRLQVGLAEADRALQGVKGGAGRSRAALTELAATLAEYPRVRYQQALVARLAGLYLSLRGFLSDQMREVGFFQQPLDALKWAVAEASQEETALAAPVPGLPSANDAAEQALASMTPDDWAELDRAVQGAVDRHPQGLTAVSQALSNSNGLKTLAAVITKEAGRFLGHRLALNKDAAEFVLGRHPEAPALEAAIRKAFDAAEPTLGAAPQGAELALVIAPASEAGERFLEAAGRVLPGVRAVSGGDRDEIVFYRACRGLTPADLERLGLVSPEVYAHACAAEGFTPHARVDVPWRGLGEVAAWSQVAPAPPSLARSQGLAQSQSVSVSQSDAVTADDPVTADDKVTR